MSDRYRFGEDPSILVTQFPVGSATPVEETVAKYVELMEHAYGQGNIEQLNLSPAESAEVAQNERGRLLKDRSADEVQIVGWCPPVIKATFSRHDEDRYTVTREIRAFRILKNARAA